MSATPRTDAAWAMAVGPLRDKALKEFSGQLERELFIQTESAKQLGRLVREKDGDRIFFRERRNELFATLQNLRAAITDFNGHGMPGFTDRALAYVVMAEADAAIAKVTQPPHVPKPPSP